MTAALQAPALPEEITAEWMDAALKSTGQLAVDSGWSVSGVTLKPLGTGQMCDSFRAAVSYTKAGEEPLPSTVVLKLPAVDPTSKATGIARGIYEREVRFYEELAPTSTLRVPKCYGSVFDPSTGNFALILQDLAPAVQGDQLLGCDLAVASSAVRSIVPLHVFRWNDESLLDLKWLAGDQAESRRRSAEMIPQLWDAFLVRYEGRIEPQVIDAGKLLFGDFARYFVPRPGPITMVHGDYRLDNLLIDSTSEVAGIVDWQTCSVGYPSTDIAYFIGAGLGAATRRAHEIDLVGLYHGELIACGIGDYSWDQCWYDYRRGAWAGLIMAVSASMIVERTDRGDEMFLTMASRHAQQCLDLNSIDTL